MSPTRILTSRLLPLIPFVLTSALHGQSVSLSGSGIYTQNFDSLPTGNGFFWTNNFTLPGWMAQTDTTPSPLPISVYNGGDPVVSGLLSMGLAGNVDRSLGFRPTTVNYGMTLLGLVLQNTGATPMSIGSVEFNGELWRTQDTANNVDGYQVFYQIAATAPASLGPFTVNNGATYAANAGVDDPGWTRVAGLEYRDANAAVSTALVPPIIRNVSTNMGLTLQPGEFLTIRWRNPNDTAGDAVMGIDDFRLSYSIPGASLVYNSAHTVGGAPNGVLSTAGGAYWLNAGAAATFAEGDSVTFSDNVTAQISVPQNAVVSTLTVSAQSGVYTIGGAGRIDGALVKSGGGGLVLTSANSFSSVTIQDGGTITAQAANALNANTLIMTNGATLNLGGDSAITQAVTGTGPLTKVGAGLLRLSGGSVPNTYTGVTVVTGGTLEAAKTAGTVAIPGNLIIEAGAAFRFGGNTSGNQIADSASVTINGGSFGDPVYNNPTNPGAAETVQNVTLNGGDFSTGRATFVVNNELIANSGIVHVSRGGSLITGTRLTLGGTMSLDGGSGTAGLESRVIIGGGGLVLNGGTINLNEGPSALAATSTGSIVVLGGNVVSTGNSNIARYNAQIVVLRADLDFQGFNRTFDVTGRLTIGSNQSPVVITNGGIVKTGPGVLLVGGTQTYPQATAVNGGKFLIDGSLASFAITVGSGGTFGGVGNVTGTLGVDSGGKLEPGLSDAGTLTLANARFGSAPGDTAAISVPVQATTPLVVTTPDALVLNGGPGSVSINVRGFIPFAGSYPVIDYDGTLGGSGFGAFVLGALPNRVQALLVHDLASTSIQLDVASVDQPVWTGAASSEWSTAALANPKNWVLQSDSSAKTDFLTGDFVLFGDSANTTVTISVDDVAPAQTRFANPTSSYVLTGTKGITGEGSLLKEEGGSLKIENTNSFTGPVVISGGKITVATVSNAGVPGTLGAGGVVTLDGGSLEITGATVTTNRALATGFLGGSLIVSGDVTLSGALSGTGSLTKAGTGTMILTGNNGSFNSRLILAEGKTRYTGQTIGGNAATIDLEGGELQSADTIESLFNDAGAILRTLDIGPAGGTINVLNASGAMAFQRVSGVTGVGPVRKIGPGAVRLQASNSGLSSPWHMEEGVLEAGAADALGTGTVTVTGGMVATRNAVVTTPIVMEGGSLGTRSGDLGEFSGSVAINAPIDVFLRSYTTPANSQTITISGLLSGAGDVRVQGNLPQPLPASLILTNPVNTYSGVFRVEPGQFLTSRPFNFGNPLGESSIVLTDAGLNLRYDGVGDSTIISVPNAVTVAGTGTSRIEVDRGFGFFTKNTIDLGQLSIGAQKLAVVGANEYTLGVAGAATLTGNATFEPTTADLLFRDDIKGDFSITKTGTGRLIIGGVTSFKGPVNVQAGTLVLNGKTAASAEVQVSGGTFAGAGVSGGNVVFNGLTTFAPGDASRGILQIDGNLTLDAATTVQFDLAHATGAQPIAGNDYAQVRIGTGNTGAVALNNALLSLSLGAGIVENDLFFLVLNDGTDSVVGTFAGLDQNSILIVAGQAFQISYTANDGTQSLAGGNDIALQAVPEPGSLLLLGGGFLLCAVSRRRETRGV